MPAGGCPTLSEPLEIRCGEHLAVAYDRAVGSSLIVRPARVQDAGQMARVHVRCWQETYRGLMPDGVLDDPGLSAARERMWTAALTGERPSMHLAHDGPASTQPTGPSTAHVLIVNDR